jgi:hypothetical protein
MIWTQGSSRFHIGWASSPHRDNCDLIREKEQHNRVYTTKSHQKFQDYYKHHGIGMPTICGYNLVGRMDDGDKMDAQFGVMGFCLPLTHGRAHFFLAHTHEHFTAYPLLRCSDGKVILRNDTSLGKPAVIVAAWGRSGGGKEDNAAREAREARKNRPFVPGESVTDVEIVGEHEATHYRRMIGTEGSHGDSDMRDAGDEQGLPPSRLSERDMDIVRERARAPPGYIPPRHQG